MDIMRLLANNAGQIVGGLIASVGAILGVLINRGAMRSSSRNERIDEYRREVRSAASSVVRAARTFIYAAQTFETSMLWINEAVRITPDHGESYNTCQAARAELDEKVTDFELLVDVYALSLAACMLNVQATMVYTAMFTIDVDSEWRNYTEDGLKDEKEEIRKCSKMFEDNALPQFQERVKKHMPHTIVGDKRRRERLLRPFTASWRWLRQQLKILAAPRDPQP